MEGCVHTVNYSPSLYVPEIQVHMYYDLVKYNLSYSTHNGIKSYIGPSRHISPYGGRVINILFKFVQISILSLADQANLVIQNLGP